MISLLSFSSFSYLFLKFFSSSIFNLLIINLKVYYFYYFRDGNMWDIGTTNIGYTERIFSRVTRQDTVFYEGLLRWTTAFRTFYMEQVLVHQYSNSMI